jgi:hypothetical protein
MSDPTAATDPKPTSVPNPDEVDPDTGAEPDGTPVENPSGRTLTFA